MYEVKDFPLIIIPILICLIEIRYLILPRIDCDLHHLNQKTKIPMDTIIIFTLQILKALKYIHSAKVLHRDLKPQNILVTLSTLQIVVCFIEKRLFFI